MPSDDEFDDLIIKGILEPAGVDSKTGEILYHFTEKLELLKPELHKRLVNSIHLTVMYLWEMGFVDMDITSDNPIVSFTTKAYNVHELSKLDPELQHFIEDAKRSFG